MNGGESGFLLSGRDGGYEGGGNGGDVCRDLGLEELMNGVVNTMAHDSLNDQSKVFTHEDDISSLLGNLSISDTIEV